MDSLVLPGTALRVSRLGFGSSGLMGRIDRRSSLRLLLCAFDVGITHFDTARSYGYGDAEVAIGDLIAAVGRDRITVATKFGILPPRRTPALSAAKAAARLVSSAHPGLRRLVGRSAQRTVRAGAFDGATATASLEASLRALRTDHVDLLLLHECGPDDLSDQIQAFLDRARRDGKVRQHGIATRPAPTREILTLRGASIPVVQIADSVLSPQFAQLPIAAGAETAVITHSALGPSFAELWDRLASDPGAARLWSERLGFDAVRDGKRLAGLFLAAAVQTNARGAVLFSSTKEENIHANVVSAGTARALCASRPALDALRSLLDQGGGRSIGEEGLRAQSVSFGSAGA